MRVPRPAASTTAVHSAADFRGPGGPGTTPASALSEVSSRGEAPGPGPRSRRLPRSRERPSILHRGPAPSARRGPGATAGVCSFGGSPPQWAGVPGGGSMSAPTTVEGLRRAFLAYFAARGHHRIPSSSLIPHGDPTLLFTTAGMVQLRPYFMGLEEPPGPRLISIQKCFRTTDVEDVGDESHLTFFEMLGNFSVGDYFKRDAVAWAWEFMTSELEIPPARLWATVYTDDDEAFALWRERGIPEQRILRYTAEQGNYWYSGEVGPCGPCSELHYDWGETPGCPACGSGECHPDVGCGRFLEVWNLVFMTYFQDEGGGKTPLPAQNIDTGAGLERVAAVLAGVRTVYETDELRGLLGEAERLTGRRYDAEGDPPGARALRAITEHARAAAFLIADGVLPGNDGRGYVLRRMIRRAIYFGHTIAPGRELFEPLVARAIESARDAYPELSEQASFIRRIAQAEEARFRATLTRGLERLEQLMERAPRGDGPGELPGREMFVLYDTHGLPPELTREVASARGLRVDEEGFEREMEAQRERSRAAGEGAVAVTDSEQRYAALGLQSRFAGYDGPTVPRRRPAAALRAGRPAVGLRGVRRHGGPRRRDRAPGRRRRRRPRLGAGPPARGRAGRDRARPDELLPGGGRAGRRPRRDRDPGGGGRAGPLPRRRHAAPGRGDRAPGRGRRGRDRRGGRGPDRRLRRLARRLAAQPHGDAPAALRAAHGARHAGAPERIAGGARPAAPRLHAPRGARAGGAARGWRPTGCAPPPRAGRRGSRGRCARCSGW